MPFNKTIPIRGSNPTHVYFVFLSGADDASKTDTGKTSSGKLSGTFPRGPDAGDDVSADKVDTLRGDVLGGSDPEDPDPGAAGAGKLLRGAGSTTPRGRALTTPRVPTTTRPQGTRCASPSRGSRGPRGVSPLPDFKKCGLPGFVRHE